MENKNIKRARKFILWSLLISLMTHVLFLGVTTVRRLADFSQAPQEEESRIRVILQENKSKPRQIVTTEKSKDKKRDPKAKFLSKETQSVDRQTTARNTGSFQKAGKGQKNGQKQASQQAQKTSQVPQKAKTAQKTPKKGRKAKKKKISFADLAVGKKVVKPKKKQKRSASSLAALGIKSGDSKKSGLSANNDFVEDIPLGDMTQLNTVEYKYYGFYHRIKQKLEQYWGNTIQKKAEALWKSGRRIPANKNRITSLEITIDNRGNIVKINVKGSSGVRELDEAAIESFNKAGPFPNPPSGMIKNGIARIEWGFVVKS